MTMVLVADDNRGMLEAVRVRLEAEGFEVVTAGDAYQALAVARRRRPDALVLDIGMPAGSGLSVLERLGDGSGPPAPPAICITGSEDPALEEDVRRLGGYGLIRKPFPASTLCELVWEAIADRAGAEAV